MKSSCGPIGRALFATPDFIRGYKYHAPNRAHAHCGYLENSIWRKCSVGTLVTFIPTVIRLAEELIIITSNNIPGLNMQCLLVKDTNKG